jgi:hypothetical protein
MLLLVKDIMQYKYASRLRMTVPSIPNRKTSDMVVLFFEWFTWDGALLIFWMQRHEHKKA